MILDKAKMAHEWALKLLEINDGNLDLGYEVAAWNYADAMQAEADKREVSIEEMMKDHVHDYLYGCICACGKVKDIEEEWQPDWSQAPEWAKYFAMDEDGEFYYFEESPSMAVRSWQPQSHGELGETFNHGYKGNWQESLRKRP